MADIWMDVDTALSEVPVNIAQLIDDTDFKTREEGVTYDQAGMDLVWQFTTTAGATTQTAVTPTTGGDYDWTHQGNGMYTIEIPASGGASINNDTEGFGQFIGYATGVLPWRGPIIGFRAAGLNNALIDSAYSATRGLAGTALPDAAADAAGGLPISDAGGLDLDAQVGTDIDAILVDTSTTLDGKLDTIDGIVDNILIDTGTTLDGKIDDILTDTGTTLDGKLDTIDGIVDAILVDTGTTLQGELDGIQADTEDIQARLPAALVGGRIDANVGAISADATAADNLELDYDGTGYNKANSTIGTTTTNTDMRGTDGANTTVPDAAGTAAGLHATTDAAIAVVDGNVDSILVDTNELQTDDVPGLIAALNDPTVAEIRTEIDSNSTQLAAIVADTNEVQTELADGGRTDLLIDAILADTNELQTDDVPGLIAALNNLSAAQVNAEVDSALADYDPPTHAELTTAVADVSVDEIQASALADLFNTDSGDTYAGSVAGSVVKEIADNAGGSALTEAGIADAVWDEATADHAAAGSTGKALTDAMSAGDPWSTALPGAYASGTAGYIIGTGLASAANIASSVWAYATRALTQTAAIITSILSGTTLTIHRGDSLSIPFSGLGDISSRTNMWFTLKESEDDGDGAALIQIDESNGLLVLNASTTVTAGHGVITVTDETAGDFTVTLTAANTAQLEDATELVYDVQYVTATGVTTLTSGGASVTADVTRATS